MRSKPLRKITPAAPPTIRAIAPTAEDAPRLVGNRVSAAFAHFVELRDDRGHRRPHLVALFIELGFDDLVPVENKDVGRGTP